MSASKEYSGDSGVWFILGLLVAVAWGLYKAVMWVIGIAVSLWKALLLVLQWLGWTLLAVLIAAAIIDLMCLALRPLIRRYRRRRAAASCPLPRAVTVCRNRPPRSQLERLFAAPVLEVRDRQYPGVALNAADVSRLKADILPPFVREEWPRICEFVVAPAYAKLLAGDPIMTGWVERYGAITARRPMFVFMRLAGWMTAGRLGWTESESYRKSDVSRLKSDPAVFEAMMKDSAVMGILALEALLGEAEPDDPAPEVPPITAARRVQAALAQSIPSEQPANEDQLNPDGEHEPEDSEGDQTNAVEDARTLAVEAVALCERLFRQDDPGWADPEGLLGQIDEAIDSAQNLHPDPRALSAIRMQVANARKRLSDFESWYRRQMDGEDDGLRWSQVLREAVLEADDARELTEPSVHRRTARRFVMATPEDLAIPDHVATHQPPPNHEVKGSAQTRPLPAVVPSRPAVLAEQIF